MARMAPKISITALLGASLMVATPSYGAELTKIRSGVHKGFVRVVFDTSGPVTNPALSVHGTSVILSIRDLRVDNPIDKTFSTTHAPLTGISGKSAEGENTELVFELNEPMTARVEQYTPDSYGGHRIVVDLRKQKTSVVDMGMTHEKPAPAPMVDPVVEPVVEHVVSHHEEAAKDDMHAMESPTLESHDTPHAAPNASYDTHAPEPKTETMVGVGTDAALNAARESMAIGDAARACAIISENFPTGTWNLEAMALEGRCLTDQGKALSAKETYEQIVTFDPEHYEARVALAGLLEQEGDVENARANYLRALSAAPTIADSDVIIQHIQELNQKLQ